MRDPASDEDTPGSGRDGPTVRGPWPRGGCLALLTRTATMVTTRTRHHRRERSVYPRSRSALAVPHAGNGESESETSMIGFIVFGLVVGVAARLLIPGRQELSVGMTMLVGVVGSIVGGVVANALGTGDVFELNILGSTVAIAASVALVVAGERAGILRRRSPR